jgi:hypothetical protein
MKAGIMSTQVEILAEFLRDFTELGPSYEDPTQFYIAAQEFLATKEGQALMAGDEILLEWYNFWSYSDDMPGKLPNGLQVRTALYLTGKKN